MRKPIRYCLALLLAAAMMTGAVFSAEAAELIDDTAKSVSHEVQGYSVADSGSDTYYVTVDWGSLVYKYTPQWTYSAGDTHGRYSGGSWSPEGEGTDIITITNYSSFAIRASFAFAGAAESGGSDYIGMADDGTLDASEYSFKQYVSNNWQSFTSLTLGADPASQGNAGDVESARVKLGITADILEESELPNTSTAIGTVTVSIDREP